MTWDPEQYLRFSDQRALPFRHLVAAVGHLKPAVVVDLGCGPGGLTATLRPVLERLLDNEHEEFLAGYGALLREAYPMRDGRTVFPFKRLFVVATKR